MIDCSLQIKSVLSFPRNHFYPDKLGTEIGPNDGPNPEICNLNSSLRLPAAAWSRSGATGARAVPPRRARSAAGPPPATQSRSTRPDAAQRQPSWATVMIATWAVRRSMTARQATAPVQIGLGVRKDSHKRWQLASRRHCGNKYVESNCTNVNRM